MTPYLAKPEQTRPSSAMGFRDHIMVNNTSHSIKRASVREKKSKSPPEKQGSSSTLPLKNVGFEDLRKTPKLPKSKQKFVWKKSKKPKEPQKDVQCNPLAATLPKDSNLYDLYAICNHRGNMDSGHYVSQCCNPIDGKWYTFDDHHVIPITSMENLITQHAYILFYTRRGSKTRYSFASDTRNEEHWIHKLTQFKMDLTRIIPSIPESAMLKAQRQGSVASAQTLSTVGGISSNSITIIPPPRMDHSSNHTPSSNFSFPSSPPSSSYHSHQFSNGSSGGGVGPVSPHRTMTYPQSLPSPSAQSSVSYFSQHSSQPFSNRTGISKQHEKGTTRTATRL